MSYWTSVTDYTANNAVYFQNFLNLTFITLGKTGSTLTKQVAQSQAKSITP